MSAAARIAGYWTNATQALQRMLLSALPLLFFVLHATGLLPLEFIQRIENYLYDVRVEFMMPRVVDPRIVIVDIDEASLAAEGQWPWPRAKVAALVDALFDDFGVRTLGFDVLFAEPERPEALRLIDELAAGPLAALPALGETLAGLRPRYEGDRILAESLIARDVALGFVFKPRPGAGERPEVGLLPPAIVFTDPRIDS
ncbi:MAG: CHASE2 domain-containing protein, partial [Steroidobacteraceae bacterium]